MTSARPPRADDRQAAARDDERSPAWTSAYVRARSLEGRLYPDAIVAELPRVPATDPLLDEWQMREDSAARLSAYLGRLARPLVILDVGCGNGWLANRLAAIGRSRVIGLDANEVELGQARRVFGRRPNLTFILGDATIVPPPGDRPDVIILASVIQYVEDLPSLLLRLAGWLRPGGEIHILDSPVYRPGEVVAARERSRRYYAALGVPEMAEVYHAHDWTALEGFRVDILYRPDSARAVLERRALGRRRSPFPWLRIRS